MDVQDPSRISSENLHNKQDPVGSTDAAMGTGTGAMITLDQNKAGNTDFNIISEHRTETADDLPERIQTMQGKDQEDEEEIEGIDDDDDGEGDDGTELALADDLAIAAASLSGILDKSAVTAADSKTPSRMSLKNVAAALEAPPGECLVCG
jgi:hypothetical protein